MEMGGNQAVDSPRRWRSGGGRRIRAIKRAFIALYLLATPPALYAFHLHFTRDDDQWDEAVGYYKMGQASKARAALIPYALSGDRRAVDLLSEIAALHPVNGALRREEALVWLLLQGDTARAGKAACYHARAFRDGLDVVPDAKEAAFWQAAAHHILKGEACSAP